MNVSAEVTFSPLQDSYEAEIILFIKALRKSGLKVMENPLSTQIYGECENVMQVLQKEMRLSLERTNQALFYLKLVKSDRSGYEPHF